MEKNEHTEVYGICENKCKVPVHPKSYTDSFVGENLLENADFKSGIINQENKTEYIGNVYGCDRWLSKNANGKIIVNSESLIFTTKNDYSAQFTQYIYQDLKGATLTFALKIKNIVGSPKLNLLGVEQALKVGLNVFTYDVTSANMPSSNKQYFYFDLNGGDSIEIEFMKLEIGEDYTGMPIWNEALELYKCKHEFEVIRGRMFNSFQHSSTNAIFKIDYQPKRKIPVVSYTKETGVNRHDGSLITVTSWKNDPITNTSFTLHVGHKETSSNVLYYRTGMGFIIDARDY